MSNGAVKVKWNSKNKCVVHNFIVRKHESGKVNITFAASCVRRIYSENWILCILLENIVGEYFGEYSDIRHCSRWASYCAHVAARPVHQPENSAKFPSKFFCNCCLSNMFDILGPSYSVGSQIWRKWQQLFTAQCWLWEAATSSTVFSGK